ncbi:hypothetical protein ACH41E_29675 [Streptomyces sp. NPDC020412]|uniref:hypothetical protein n=1 Tax=Streptomyces sp. NPDC020412 TaxID=3365073 RepID=UPI0037B7E65C
MTDGDAAWGISVVPQPAVLAAGEQVEFHVKISNLSEKAAELHAKLAFSVDPNYDPHPAYVLFERLSDTFQKTDLPDADFGSKPFKGTVGKDISWFSTDVQKAVVYALDSHGGALLEPGETVEFTVPRSAHLTVSKTATEPGRLQGAFYVQGTPVSTFTLSFARNASQMSVTQDPPGWDGGTDALLSYTVTGPIDQAIDAGSTASINITATNLTTHDVYCSRIAVTVPTGTGESALCEAKDLPGPDGFRLPKGWTKDKAVKGETYAARAEGGKPRLVKPGAPVVFVLANVPLCRTPGTASLTLTETSSVAKTGKQLSRGTQAPFTKFPAAFLFDYFAPTVAATQHGQKAKLVWAGRNVHHYRMHSDDKAVTDPGPNDHEVATGTLQQTCGYVLEAFADDWLSHRHQVVIEVVDQSLTLHDVTVIDEFVAHASAYRHTTVQYSEQQQKGKALTLAEAVQGDRYAVVGMEKPSDYSSKALVLKLQRAGNSAPEDLGTMGSAWPYFVPSQARLYAEPLSTMKPGATYGISLALSTPRVLPPPDVG